MAECSLSSVLFYIRANQWGGIHFNNKIHIQLTKHMEYIHSNHWIYLLLLSLAMNFLYWRNSIENPSWFKPTTINKFTIKAITNLQMDKMLKWIYNNNRVWTMKKSLHFVHIFSSDSQSIDSCKCMYIRVNYGNKSK